MQSAAEMEAEANLQRKRKVAKERIASQFSDALLADGLLVVDCGPELGYAVVTNVAVGCGGNIQWISQRQVRTLAGRID